MGHMGHNIPAALRMSGRIRRSCTVSFRPTTKLRPEWEGDPLLSVDGDVSRVLITVPDQREVMRSSVKSILIAHLIPYEIPFPMNRFGGFGSHSDNFSQTKTSWTLSGPHLAPLI